MNICLIAHINVVEKSKRGDNGVAARVGRPLNEPEEAMAECVIDVLPAESDVGPAHVHVKRPELLTGHQTQHCGRMAVLWDRHRQ